ncbi:MAG: glutathione S-transferase family protein [Sphingomonadales bacterium]|nr:glutathione S-transferase family protein [Sphingomonadales bacterium]
MLTFYHSPNSRSTSILALIHELGALDQVQVRLVDIPRQDGSGRRDPANPHPEGKVPFLTDGADWVRERGAIVAYLCERFPQAGLAPMPGEALRGRFLSWLSYYQGVMEPVVLGEMMGVSHPMFRATYRDSATMAERLAEALAEGPYLLGERFSAADLLLHSPFAWFPDLCPDVPVIRDWVARCAARPSMAWAQEHDQRALAEAG